jgi:ribosome-associated protein
MMSMSDLPGIELAPGVWTDRAELRFGFSRSSGPGGQNVNKVNSKTELRIRPEALHGLSDGAMGRLRTLAGRRITLEGDLLIVAESERTQESNRQICLKKLRDLIITAAKVPKIRRKTRPSRGAKERRLEGKRVNSAKKRLRSATPE